MWWGGLIGGAINNKKFLPAPSLATASPAEAGPWCCAGAPASAAAECLQAPPAVPLPRKPPGCWLQHSIWATPPCGTTALGPQAFRGLQLLPASIARCRGPLAVASLRPEGQSQPPEPPAPRPSRRPAGRAGPAPPPAGRLRMIAGEIGGY